LIAKASKAHFMNDISDTHPDPYGKESTFIKIPENSTNIIIKGGAIAYPISTSLANVANTKPMKTAV
jgi:hypothetical protein